MGFGCSSPQVKILLVKMAVNFPILLQKHYSASHFLLLLHHWLLKEAWDLVLNQREVH